VVDATAGPPGFGAESMVAPLREVLVKRPGLAFGRAFDDPGYCFLHPVDLEAARRQHDELTSMLSGLGVTVRELGAETSSPDLVYTFDPAIVGNRGAMILRPGKATRLGEETALEKWFVEREIPVVGRIESPGTAEGGDTFWLEPGVFCVGRSLRTNRAGAGQLAALVGGQVHVFDLLRELEFDLISVPEEELPTLGCNILAVRPGVLIMAEGNPATMRAMEERGCEVHTFRATEIGINGGGGPTCLTRPILRDTHPR
jgi:dimethylargininase